MSTTKTVEPNQKPTLVDWLYYISPVALIVFVLVAFACGVR
jgi:hypothetical protein